MEGLLIHTSLYGERELRKILSRKILGNDKNPRGSQIPLFADKPIVFCSYFCDGYKSFYGDYSNRPGIVFESDSPIIYASPIDSWEFLREGNWMLGYERFIFPTIDKMLDKYPTSESFKWDFQKYFRGLNPGAVYPEDDVEEASYKFEGDTCLKRDWNPGCNEIALPKPLKIKNARIFRNVMELEKELVMTASIPVDSRIKS